MFIPTHPAELNKRANTLLFGDLVKTWLQLDVPYMIDLIDDHARMRLTSTRSGRYVIFGPGHEHATVYPDELLALNVPAPGIRVLVDIPNNLFDVLDIKDHHEMALYAVKQRLSGQATAVRVVREECGGLNYKVEDLSPAQVSSVRDAQYAILRGTWDRLPLLDNKTIRPQVMTL